MAATTIGEAIEGLNDGILDGVELAKLPFMDMDRDGNGVPEIGIMLKKEEIEAFASLGLRLEMEKGQWGRWNLKTFLVYWSM
ncbi:unnamed protein product [Camellia sinensis]